jgi:hypothetical protein
MASLQVDWHYEATPPYRALVTIPQDYDGLTLIQGSAPNGVWELDTLKLWNDLKALEASEDGIVYGDLQTHNAQYTIAGTTYADAIQFLAKVTFYNSVPDEDWTVVITGSNNDLFDIYGDVYLPTPHLALVPNNSAGLVVVASTDEVSILAKIDTLIAAQDLTNEQLEAETITQVSSSPLTTPGKVVKRNTVTSRRWEANAWEDEAGTIGYRGKGLEKVGQFSEVAFS